MTVIVDDHNQPGQLLGFSSSASGRRRRSGSCGHLAGEDVAQRIEGGSDATGRHGAVEQVRVVDVRQQVEPPPVACVFARENRRQFKVLGQLVGGQLHDQRADHGNGAFTRPDHRHHSRIHQVGGGGHRLNGGMGAGEHLGLTQQDRVDRFHGGFGGRDVQREPRHGRDSDAGLEMVGIGTSPLPQSLRIVDETDDPSRARM